MRRSTLRSAVLVSSLALLGAATMAASAWAASGTSTISGAVWNDADRNGVYEAGESPFTNEGIQVFDSTGAWAAGAATDANGRFSVSGLPDGTYTVAFDYPSWAALFATYVPDTTGSLSFRRTVNVTGSATADFGLRQIVRSTTPITTARTSQGTVVNSYDDVVTAQAVANDLASGALLGAEAPQTTVDFDLESGSSYTGAIGGTTGSYSGFSATVYVGWGDWVTRQDFTLFYEYAHAWSEYNSHIVQQDPTYTSYLKARGLYGNPNLGSSLVWEPVELIADDYRQLFGSATASSYAQGNTQIPPASQVNGLKTFLSTTFMTSTTSTAPPAAPTSLSATAGDTQVALSWPAVSSATSYTVLRCTGSGCQPTGTAVSTTSTSYTDTSVSDFTTYTYAVVATNSVGSSAPSPVATATPATTVTLGGLAMAPQPVHTLGTLTFTLSTGASTTVTILSPNGKKVTTLLSGVAEPSGTVSVGWSVPRKAATGTYTATVTATDAGGHTASAKLAFAVS